MAGGVNGGEDRQGCCGFTGVSCGRVLLLSMLHQHNSHREAAARIVWCISHKAIGVVLDGTQDADIAGMDGALSVPRDS